MTLQNEYSLIERGIEAELAPTCERLGVSILPYLPLKSGLLSGKYVWAKVAPEGTCLAGGGLEGGSAGTDEHFDIVDELREFAKARGVEMIDVAIAGLAAQPAVGSVIRRHLMAQERSGSRCEHRRHPVPLAREQLARHDRVDTRVHSMKPSTAQPDRDCILAEAHFRQLPPRHHPVLLPCQLRELPVVTASP